MGSIEQLGKLAAELTTAGRKHIPKKDFAIPSKAGTTEEKTESGNYPIENRGHAANALSRVSQHGSSSEKSQVHRRVCDKYPTLPSCKTAAEPSPYTAGTAVDKAFQAAPLEAQSRMTANRAARQQAVTQQDTSLQRIRITKPLSGTGRMSIQPNPSRTIETGPSDIVGRTVTGIRGSYPIDPIPRSVSAPASIGRAPDVLSPSKVTTNPFAKQSATDLGKLAAESAYEDVPALAIQPYHPIARRRMELTPLEQQMLQEGGSQWLPQIFQSYATPIPKMMASPGRQAALWGAPAAALGGLAAGAATEGNPLATAGGAGVLGLLAAALAYRNQQASNEGLLEMMRRLPPGATKRDLLSDPAVQADKNRQAMLEVAMLNRR